MGKDGHEELLGTPLEPGSHRQTVEDNLLGRPRVAEKSFAPDAKKESQASRTPEERFAELQRLTSTYLSEEDEAVLAKAREIAARVAQRHGVEISVDVEQAQAASAAPADSPVVLALEQAVERVYGVQPRPVGIGGATVAALLRRKGLPAAVWACIQNTCHQPDERASISAACKDAQVFAHILMRRDAHA